MDSEQQHEEIVVTGDGTTDEVDTASMGGKQGEDSVAEPSVDSTAEEVDRKTDQGEEQHAVTDRQGDGPEIFDNEVSFDPVSHSPASSIQVHQSSNDHEETASSRSSDASVAGRPRAATLSETLIAAQSVIREKNGASSDALAPESTSRFPHHRSSHASSIASSATAESATSQPTIIHGVVLVGFNHSLGPIVDYSYPPELQKDEDIIRSLPFLALPDGAHMVGHIHSSEQCTSQADCSSLVSA